MTERVEGARLDQRFHDTLVARGDLNLVEKVGERREVSLSTSGRGNRSDHAGADVSDGAEAEPDVRADRGEGPVRLVDIRGEDLDAELAALGQVDRHLVLVVTHRGQQCR